MHAIELKSTLKGVLTMTILMAAALSSRGVAQADPPSDRSGLIRWAFNELNADKTEILDDFYHEDVHFVDPVVDVKGLDDLRKHYAHQYGAVKEIHFAFIHEYIAGDTHTIEWEMTFSTKRLNKGKPFKIPGASVVTFQDEKVIYHRDFFDLGDMIYERLPVIRAITKRVKKRLSFESKEKKKR
jgi:ketosteroid isomerase-like protein